MHYAVLFCTLLYYSVPCCTMLYYDVLQFTALDYTVLCCTTMLALEKMMAGEKNIRFIFVVILYFPFIQVQCFLCFGIVYYIMYCSVKETTYFLKYIIKLLSYFN